MSKVECRIEPQPLRGGETRTVTQMWGPLPSNGLDAQAPVRWGWVTVDGQDPECRVVLSMPYEVAEVVRNHLASQINSTRSGPSRDILRDVELAMAEQGL